MAPTPRNPACGQLPDGKEDALLILQALRRMVELPGFWEAPSEAGKPTAAVVLIGKTKDG